MTRWDCDVKLWRRLPCSFPAFHGWPVSGFDIVLSSTVSLRYICCRACYRWVSESPLYHTCTSPLKLGLSDFAVAEEDMDEGPRQGVYVVSTEENSENQICGMYKTRMRLEYFHDIEEWVFMDCVEY